MHDTVSYPGQVSHVAVPSAALGPDGGRGQILRLVTRRSREAAWEAQWGGVIVLNTETLKLGTDSHQARLG